MAIVKITVYDDNSTVDKIDMILSKSGTKHMIKHGESENSTVDVIVFDKVDPILEHIKNKFKGIDIEIIEMNIDSCDVTDFPLPQLIPDDPEPNSYAVYKAAGILVAAAIIVGFFVI